MTLHSSGASQEAPTAIPPDLTARQSLERAIDDLMLSCPGLAKGLGADCPPHIASLADGLRHYGGPSGEWTAKFSLWLHWRNGMRVGAAWDEWTRASAAAARAKVAPIDEPVGPDEAVGRAAPEDDGTADQQRLGVVEHL